MDGRTYEQKFGMSGVTRRQFLRGLGAIGGSALVYNAMTALHMVRASSATLPALSGSANGTRVIVLGAGLAGMTTAYELGKLGYDCRILEARNRAGGRNWSVRRGDEFTELGGEKQVVRFEEGTYFNAGPWRIPAHHESTLHYCKEFNVPLQVFVNENDAAYVYNQEVGGPLSGKRVRLREVKADMHGYTSELLAKAINQNDLDAPLSAEDTERLVDYLVRFGYLSSADAVYKGTGGRGYEVPPGAFLQSGTPTEPYGLASLLQAELVNYYRSVPSWQQPVTVFQPIGGMDQIAKGFERAVGSQIEYGAEVREIRKTSAGVRVVYRDKKTGRTEEVTGDYCVCTIPLSVLNSVTTDFSANVRRAIQAVSYEPTGKIALQMKRRFWEEDDRIFGGHTQTNLPMIGTISYPSYDYHSKRGIVQGYYNFGTDAIQMSLRSPVERIAHALEQGNKIHPQYQDSFETGFSISWHRVQYNLGGWASWSESARKDAYPTLVEPDGAIYFAGEHMSYLTGWQAGAIESAWMVMEKLHKRVKQG